MDAQAPGGASPQSAPTQPPAGGAPADHGPLKHAASPESLDNIIVTTKPRAWWALIAIAVAVVIGLIWSLVAVIPLQKSATGVVSPYVYTRVVSATAPGIFSTSAGPNSNTSSIWDAKVNAGQVLGTITSYDGSTSTDVVSPVEGNLSAVFASQGVGVEPGDPLVEVSITPNAQTGLTVVAWVPESTALTLKVGSTAAVTITDNASGDSFQVDATINAVAQTPSSQDSMTTISGSQQLSEEWMTEAGGAPYRIGLSFNLDSWPSQYALPAPGSVVNIVDTYAEMHPIQLLFGGA